MMTFKESIKTVYCKYATIKGRASIKEYWNFVWYFLIVVGFAMAILFVLLFGFDINIENYIVGFIWVFHMANITPLLCVSVRRLHDTGRSGYALLWLLFQPLGSAIFVYYMGLPSDGDNEYGTIDGREVDDRIEKTDIDL